MRMHRMIEDWKEPLPYVSMMLRSMRIGSRHMKH